MPSTAPLPHPTLPAAPPRSAQPCRVLLVGARFDAGPAALPLFMAAPEFPVCGRCSSVAEAIESWRATRPDVIVTDVLLADGDAFELLRRLGKLQSGARVLVLTQRHEKLCAERLLRAGALGYVKLDAPTEEIRRAIRRVAAGEMHISATLGIELQRRFLQSAAMARQAPGCALEVLSTREFQIFQLIGSGMTPARISRALSVSVKTVESHRQHIRDKLALGSVTQFARCALECASQCRLERGADATCELDPLRRPLPGMAGFRPDR